ncbi:MULTISPECIES: M20 family metallopeptidase [Rahnella]|uniref:Peptidase M20 domain-containing protein 2 n=1 Tax=Rahnella sp. (strain Y9602) TaxID=2703885 RepID=A0A0H3FE62_RAHSY|nr:MULTISPECIES: M20 family metallopeptidase [Rahnella]AFE59712.1 amidohydrolase [Rahnella aquatilis HX2]AYA08264.1 M20 family peptidase [Rahnella aquatilis]ADW75067.1 amidohydrolase [Rahnella aceris]AZP43490.1 M20 family metallopeptidase [Rahnella aquatilis]AZP47828.1 M20 family metallopeptidase [Rahnella aquatilis]
MSNCTTSVHHAGEPKTQIIAAVDSLAAQASALAMNIHANPELSFEEVESAAALIAPLRAAGFEIEEQPGGLATAFRATYDSGKPGPVIALLAEYDALKDLGHACGHNLIGTASVTAALALKQQSHLLTGRLEVIGTPAEEEGGGKIILSEKGIFDHVDAVMMFHPRDKTMVVRGGLACVDAVFKFYGKAAHAASAPQNGISALDAVIHTFNGINALRQMFTDDVRVHGIISDGGSATNIVPAYAEAKFLMRASTVRGLSIVKQKVFDAAQGAALMAGARLEVEEGLTYAERNNNLTLAEYFKQNLDILGVEVVPPPLSGGIGSSDIGNVSQITAAIHPYIRIGDVLPHTPEFAKAAGSGAGLQAMLQAAKALAMTTVDLCQDGAKLQAVREEFLNWKSHF